jgi:hypothetical protein
MGPNDIVFEPNDKVASMIGELLNRAGLQTRYPTNNVGTYVLAISGNMFSDSACRRGIGSLANTCYRTGNKRNPGCQLNAKLVAPMGSAPTRNWPTVVATRRIRNGEEILVDYGSDYAGAGVVTGTDVTRPASRYSAIEHMCTHNNV